MTQATRHIPCTPEDVLHFWFEKSTPKQWFAKDDTFDAAIQQRFGATLEAAAQGELWTWRTSPLNRLAEIIVLDQFSRNVFRDTPRSFEQDRMALVLTQEVIAQQLDLQLSEVQRPFAYLPLMHSESLAVQDESLRCYTALGNPVNLEFAKRHRDIIVRFGRYPHRNTILGRESTAEEIAFLQTPGSSF